MLLFYELHSDFFDNKIFCFMKLVFHDNTPHLLAHWSYLSISREWANSIASYLYFKENWAVIMIISLLTYYSRFMHLSLSLCLFWHQLWTSSEGETPRVPWRVPLAEDVTRGHCIARAGGSCAADGEGNSQTAHKQRYKEAEMMKHLT